MDRLILNLIRLAFCIGWERGRIFENRETYQDNGAKREQALQEFLDEHIPEGKIYPHRAERLRDEQI